MAKLLKTLTKELELDEGRPDAYFNYIVESFINGNRNQVRDLFNDMKKDDKRDFFRFLRGSYSPDGVDELIDLCLDELLI